MKLLTYILSILTFAGFAQQKFSLCDGFNFRFNSEVENGSKNWYLNGVKLSNQDTTISIIDTGIYIVELISENQIGCTEVVKKTIEINDCLLLYIPSAFTPNDDGLNDTFKPVGNIKDYSLEIYDRWGTMIYATTKGWPGNNINDLYTFRLIYYQDKKQKIVYGKVQLLL